MSRLSNIFKSLTEQPGYTLMRGAARFNTLRSAVTKARRFSHTAGREDYLRACEMRFAETAFPPLDRIAFVKSLREDGIAFGLTLPRSTVDEIREFANRTECYADRMPQHGFNLPKRADAESALGKPILLAQYFNVAQKCLAVKRLMDDPVLNWIACQYLESIPTFVGANLWWTFPVNATAEDRDRHAHLFHRDVDDFRFFKYFFYLTDVEAGEGGHVCVVASHEHPPRSRFGDPWNLRRYSNTEVEHTYAPGQIKEICGAAGTGFAENTLCIHKGRTPVTNPRLLLQLQYALFDYGVMHDNRELQNLSLIA
jgi:hypothetical protein